MPKSALEFLKCLLFVRGVMEPTYFSRDSLHIIAIGKDAR